VLALRFDGLQDWAAGPAWVFTDSDPRSVSYGITVYLTPGCSLEQVAQRLQVKRDEILEGASRTGQVGAMDLLEHAQLEVCVARARLVAAQGLEPDQQRVLRQIAMAHMSGAMRALENARKVTEHEIFGVE